MICFFFIWFLLLLQGSLFFTRIHTNCWWTVAQEVIVLAHGTLVAVMQGNELWRLFALGLGGIFVITRSGIRIPLRICSKA